MINIEYVIGVVDELVVGGFEHMLDLYRAAHGSLLTADDLSHDIIEAGEAQVDELLPL